MDFKGFYKSRPIISAVGFSAKLSQTLKAERKEKQRELFWGSRIAHAEITSSKPQPHVGQKKNPRAEMLQKWKAEKMKKLEEEKKNKKPIFKVGVIKRTATGSPVITQLKTYTKKIHGTKKTAGKPKINNPEPNRSGVLTRAQARNMSVQPIIPETEPLVKAQKLFNKCYKYEDGKKVQIDSHVFKVPEAVAKLPCSGLTFPGSARPLSRSQTRPRTNEKEAKANTRKTEKSVEKEKKVESKPAEVKREIKDLSKDNKEEQEASQTLIVTPERGDTGADDYLPIHYSPFVTVRSGKKSKRKSKKSLTFNIDEQIKKDEDEFKNRIFSFRKYIECETKRLLEASDKWKQIYLEFQEVPPEVEGDIDSVTGKTKLLTSDKFMQFKGLIDKCENGDPLVKLDDLQGFQDWISIEVEKIDGEFRKLENRKCNNWESENTAPVHDVKVQKVKVAKNGAKKPAGKSQIRAHILAARKLIKEGKPNGDEVSQLPTIAFELPVKPVTPVKKESLLEEVLNSETKKQIGSSSTKLPLIRERRNSGLEIMIATQKNKFPTPVKVQKSPLLSDYKIYVESTVTPNKSILKKTPKTLSSSKGRVRFKNQSENLIKEGRGLNEKYFRSLTNDDDCSPARTILGDLGNVSSEGMKTRSRSRSRSRNQQVNC